MLFLLCESQIATMTSFKSPVVLVASELIPFAQTGGLGDMLGSLGPALQDQGVPVTYILPRYRDILTAPLEDLGNILNAHIFKGRHPRGIDVYFIDIPHFFDRPNLYGDGGYDYPDNLARFAAFSRIAIEVIRRYLPSPAVIHCHDWQTALVPVYLKTLFAQDPAFKETRTLLTIHNLGYQGLFPAEELACTGLEPHHFSPDLLEYYGKINLLKAGILSANGITTVSPSYAQEILTSELGYGLEGVLQMREGDLRGIQNGIDIIDWNPERDNHLPVPFSAKDPSGKKLCKQFLQREMKLPELSDHIVIGMICRLVPQKGVDLVLDVIPRLIDLPIQWIFLGSGDSELESQLSAIAAAHPQKIKISVGFHPRLPHLIEAGSDFFLMPSRYEPCGYNQMYSQRYGTLPIVRATGGLKDTVCDITQFSDTGTGFVFQEPTADALHACILRAVQFYGNTTERTKAIKRAMTIDFSWARSVKLFMDFYQELLSHPPHTSRGASTLG